MNVADVIDIWPSAEQFSDAIGLKYRSHGRVMKFRGSIPREHWERVIAAAEQAGRSLTISDLEAAHEASRARADRKGKAASSKGCEAAE